MLQQKWRRLREAVAVARYGAALGDRLTLFATYCALLLRPPSRRERTVALRMGTRVYRVTFRESDIFTLGEMLFEGQYRLPDHLAPGAVVLDAGANIGIFSLLMLARYPGIRLFAFEPAPDNLSVLQRNLAQLPGASVEAIALSDTTGTAVLHFGAHEAEHSLLAGHADAGGTRVPTERLEDWLSRQAIDQVALLKVDVEGSEAALVRGLGARLSDVDVMIGEFHESLVAEADFYPVLEAAGLTVSHRDRALDGGPVHLFRAVRRPG